MVGEDLQLNGQVDLADTDAVRNIDDGWREVQDAGHTGSNKGIGSLLGCCAWRGDDADGDRTDLSVHHSRP